MIAGSGGFRLGRLPVRPTFRLPRPGPREDGMMRPYRRKSGGPLYKRRAWSGFRTGFGVWASLGEVHSYPATVPSTERA